MSLKPAVSCLWAFGHPLCGGGDRNCRPSTETQKILEEGVTESNFRLTDFKASRQMTFAKKKVNKSNVSMNERI